MEEEERKRRDRERAEREEAALRDREKAVKETYSEALKEREKERAHHARDEATQMLLALLADLIRTPQTSWHQAKKTLKGDERYASPVLEGLTSDEKEALYKRHVDDLFRKHRDLFFRLLNDLERESGAAIGGAGATGGTTGGAAGTTATKGTQVSMLSDWKEIRKLVRDDPRSQKILIPSNQVLFFPYIPSDIFIFLFSYCPLKAHQLRDAQQIFGQFLLQRSRWKQIRSGFYSRASKMVREKTLAN